MAQIGLRFLFVLLHEGQLGITAKAQPTTKQASLVIVVEAKFFFFLADFASTEFHFPRGVDDSPVLS